MTVKIRKVGTSNVLTVPSDISVPKDAEFEVYAGEQGSIVFLPRKQNPFMDDQYAATHDLRHDSAFADVRLTGLEDGE